MKTLEIYCLVEDPSGDDFLFLLRRNKESGGAESAGWGPITVEHADDESTVEAFRRALWGAEELEVFRSWPLCDHDGRSSGADSVRHLGIEADGDFARALRHFPLDPDAFTVVPYSDALALVGAEDRRVITLARHGAWLERIRKAEAA